MVSDLSVRIAAAMQPVYDIRLPPTPTVRAAGVAADLVPAPGLDIAVVGTLAALVAGVLVLILHRRRGK